MCPEFVSALAISQGQLTQSWPHTFSDLVQTTSHGNSLSPPFYSEDTEARRWVRVRLGSQLRCVRGLQR